MTKRQCVRKGPPAGPRLTKTDLQVLQKIANESFQTYRELREGPLKDHGRSHSWHIMKKLVGMGLLLEQKGDGEKKRNGGGHTLGWVLSRQGRRKFIVIADKSTILDERPPQYKSSFEHDVKLRGIKQVLCKSPVILEWVNENALKRQTKRGVQYLHLQDQIKHFRLIPDALLTLKINGRVSKAALELELTRKTKRRLYRKFESHIANRDFNHILFIVEGAHLLKAIWNIYQDVLSDSIHVKFLDKKNGVYFILLEDLQTQGIKAKFKGLNNSFCFANLNPNPQ